MLTRLFAAFHVLKFPNICAKIDIFWGSNITRKSHGFHALETCNSAGQGIIGGAWKDIDLGVVIDEFKIWKSIAHLDYDFFKKDAADEGIFFVISIDRLLWTRVCAMDVEKYRNDLKLMKEYYFKTYTNQKYHQEAMLHENSYRKMNGVVFGGMYKED